MLCWQYGHRDTSCQELRNWREASLLNDLELFYTGDPIGLLGAFEHDTLKPSCRTSIVCVTNNGERSDLFDKRVFELGIVCSRTKLVQVHATERTIIRHSKKKIFHVSIECGVVSFIHQMSPTFLAHFWFWKPIRF